jgi:hypothetical protein
MEHRGFVMQKIDAHLALRIRIHARLHVEPIFMRGDEHNAVACTDSTIGVVGQC